MNSFITRLLEVNLLKTVVVNFRFLPLRQAIKLPIVVYWHTIISGKGRVTILSNVSPFMIQIGRNGLGIVDGRYQRTKILLEGELITSGKARLGGGSKISVARNAKLKFGDNFNISGNSSIIAEKEIIFGDNCLLSWDILIMDSDYHAIYGPNNERLNYDKAITISNNVWIGCRATILKGVSIPDNCVIAACSEVTKSQEQSNVIYGGKGNDMYVIKKNINWKE